VGSAVVKSLKNQGFGNLIVRSHKELDLTEQSAVRKFFDDTRQTHTERRLHTVIIEPDHPRVSLVWHSPLPCHFKVQKLKSTAVTLKQLLRAGYPPIKAADLEE